MCGICDAKRILKTKKQFDLGQLEEDLGLRQQLKVRSNKIEDYREDYQVSNGKVMGDLKTNRQNNIIEKERK